MNAVRIDVSNGRSTIAVLCPLGVTVFTPFEVQHTPEGIGQLIQQIKSLEGETRSPFGPCTIRITQRNQIISAICEKGYDPVLHPSDRKARRWIEVRRVDMLMNYDQSASCACID